MTSGILTFSKHPPFWSCAPKFLYQPKFYIRTIARVRSSSEPYLLQFCYIMRCPTWGECFALIRDGGGGGVGGVVQTTLENHESYRFPLELAIAPLLLVELDISWKILDPAPCNLRNSSSLVVHHFLKTMSWTKIHIKMSEPFCQFDLDPPPSPLRR